MAEITLRDLCRWDRRLVLIPPTGAEDSAVLERGVSWIVSVRAAPPLLPPLRGDEIVVLSRRVIEQIEHGQTMQLDDLLRTLASEPVAALLTETGFSDEPLPGLPLLTMPAPFPQDAETTLNRLITERRAELYRIGNDLSRRLSQAAVDPQGVEGLLAVAADLCRRSILLQDDRGHLIARSSDNAVDPASEDELRQARAAGGPLQLQIEGDCERLIVPLNTASGPAFLVMTGPAGALTEVDRLVLTQTAGTAGIVLAQGNQRTVQTTRNQAIAEILLGRLASEAALSARARGLGFDPANQFLVGALKTESDPDRRERVISQLLGGLPATAHCEIGERIALLVSGSSGGEFARRLDRWRAQSSGSSMLMAISEPVTGISGVAGAFRQAWLALGLIERNALRDPVVHCDRLDEFSVFRLFFDLWGNRSVAAFRDDVLGPLEAYDTRRGTELISTLQAYLTTGGAVSEAAASLNVHRNTLAYRIGRIAELTGRDLSDPQERLLMRVALLCRDLASVPEPN